MQAKKSAQTGAGSGQVEEAARVVRPAARAQFGPQAASDGASQSNRAAGRVSMGGLRKAVARKATATADD